MTTTTPETFTFRTRATVKTSSELWCCVVDTHGGTQDEHDRMRDRVEQGWHRTKSTLRIEGLTRRDLELLIKDLEYFAEDSDWAPELMFRARPFLRMAQEIRELLRDLPNPYTTTPAHKADQLTEDESRELASLMHFCGEYWLREVGGERGWSAAPMTVHRVEICEGRWGVSVDFDPRADSLRSLLAEQLGLCVEELHERRPFDLEAAQAELDEWVATGEAARQEAAQEAAQGLTEEEREVWDRLPVQTLILAARELLKQDADEQLIGHRGDHLAYVVKRLQALGVRHLRRLHGPSRPGCGERCCECRMVEAEQELEVQQLDGEWDTLLTCGDCARGAS